MSHKPSFSIGDIVINNGIVKEFKVGNVEGMHKSNTYRCLVIIYLITQKLYTKIDGVAMSFIILA